MLREIPRVRQIKGEPKRRWFTDDYFDLTIWQHRWRRVFYGFQLSYGKPAGERALTWRQGRGFEHHRVDGGEASPFDHQTPILRPDGAFHAQFVLRRFLAAAQGIEPRVAAYVAAQLRQHPACAAPGGNAEDAEKDFSG